MNLKWIKDLSDDERKEFKESRLASQLVLTKLKALLEEELEQSIKETSSEKNYEKPSWAFLQAHKLGEQEALRKVIKLLED